MKHLFIFQALLFIAASCSGAKEDYSSLVNGSGVQGGDKPAKPVLETYEWPTAPGQAKLSEHYQVYVTVEGEAEQELQVLQSDPIVNSISVAGVPGEDHQAQYTKQRSFSFVPVSFDDSKGKKLTFRVVSKDGYSGAEISPSSYNITPDGSGSSVTFMVEKANKYISVFFNCTQNTVKVGTQYSWVKHMLMIYVDPPETMKPNTAKQRVVYYSDDVDDDALAQAGVIYFSPGYHNLKNHKGAGQMINEHGGLTLTSNQHLYIAGGAFVEGYVLRRNYGDTNQAFYGRGILSGRQYTWQPDNPDRLMGQLMMGGENSTFDGLIVMESPNHGVVSRGDCIFRNVKFLGWHCNNDGFRPGNNTKISNCFLRACDDFFYNYSLEVKDCVLWPAFNGSIMTNGWQYFDIGGSLMENIDIIYTEWTGLGNNKGLIMSQNEYSYNPPLNSKTTTFRNIRFEGSIPGFVNLKPNSGAAPLLESKDDLGWMGNMLFENITIDAHQNKANNLIKGGKPAVKGDPDSIWWVKDITFRNVTIGGEKLTDANKSKWFTIDPATTSNIVFE